MKFKRFMSAGLAAATGLTLAMAGSSAQANVSSLVYTSVGTVPTLSLNIGIHVDYDINGDGSQLLDVYDVTMSTSDGFGDLIGFAYDWNLASTTAYLIEASVVAEDKSGTEFTPDLQVCLNANECGFSSNNLGGGAVLNDGTKAPGDWENFYAFGTNGAGKDFVNNINLKVAAIDESLNFVDAQGPLVDGVPFARLAARVTSTQDENMDPAKQTMQFGGDDSLKFAFFSCVDGEVCDPDRFPPPEGVPEIDGPVLMQVGFALGGLYLLLLGRRRQEDELAHAV